MTEHYVILLNSYCSKRFMHIHSFSPQNVPTKGRLLSDERAHSHRLSNLPKDTQPGKGRGRSDTQPVPPPPAPVPLRAPAPECQHYTSDLSEGWGVLNHSGAVLRPEEHFSFDAISKYKPCYLQSLMGTRFANNG